MTPVPSALARLGALEFERMISLNPQSPTREQVPACAPNSTTPWQFTNLMPKNGEKSQAQHTRVAQAHSARSNIEQARAV